MFEKEHLILEISLKEMQLIELEFLQKIHVLCQQHEYPITCQAIFICRIRKPPLP